MYVEIIVGAGLTLFSFLVYQVASTMIRNWSAQHSFKKNLPRLTVLPNPSIFDGHNSQIFYAKRNCHIFSKLHENYGPTFGWFYCGRPCLSTIDLDIIKTIAIDGAEEHTRKLQYNIPLAEFEVDSILSCGGSQYRRLRKAIAPAFSSHKVKSPNVQKEMDAVINQLIESIENKLVATKFNHSGESVLINAEDLFHRYTLALVFSCFYKQHDTIDFNSQEDPLVEEIHKTLKEAVNPVVMLCVMFPIIIPLIELLIGYTQTQGSLIYKVKQFIKQQTLMNLQAKQQLEKAKQLGSTNIDKENFVMEDGSKFKQNMVDYVIDQLHSGKLTESEYMNSAFSLFSAANHTTADAISRLTYHLAANPSVQDKLRDSVRMDGLKSIYLQWCIDESIRLFPPSPMGCSRTLEKDVMTKFGLIPAGTFVFTPAFTVNRDKKIWGSDADIFIPERWENANKFSPVQFLSFGAGKRICLGKEFALSGIRKLIVELIVRYRFLPTPETNAESIKDFDSNGFIMLVPNSPINVRVSRL